VKPSDVKSYIVEYRNRKSGASRRKTIGQHGPLLTFHKAKERARIILADALKGNDPVADDRAVRDAPTMRELAADYLEHHAVPKKRAKSVENDRSMIDRIIQNSDDEFSRRPWKSVAVKKRLATHLCETDFFDFSLFINMIWMIKILALTP
jgi:hypothetical protein